jgi:hypothetical protein
MRTRSGSCGAFRVDSSSRRLLPPALLLLASGSVFAVAGGAGGGGFSGSSDDAGGIIIELIFWIIWSLPFPYNIIGLAIFGGFLLYAARQGRAISGLNKIPSIAKATSQSFSAPAGRSQERRKGAEADGKGRPCGSQRNYAGTGAAARGARAHRPIGRLIGRTRGPASE